MWTFWLHIRITWAALKTTMPGPQPRPTGHLCVLKFPWLLLWCIMRHENHCSGRTGRIQVYWQRWELQLGMRRMQDGCSQTAWYHDCCRLPWMGWWVGLVWRKNGNPVGKEKLSEEFEVLERRLDFILKATEEILWSPPYFMWHHFQIVFGLFSLITGSMWANEKLEESVLSWTVRCWVDSGKQRWATTRAVSQHTTIHQNKHWLSCHCVPVAVLSPLRISYCLILKNYEVGTYSMPILQMWKLRCR